MHSYRERGFINSNVAFVSMRTLLEGFTVTSWYCHTKQITECTSGGGN